jgi:hypothetical protein
MFIRAMDIDILYELHTGLRANLHDEDLKAQLAKNLETLEALAALAKTHVDRGAPAMRTPLFPVLLAGNT